MIIICNVYVYNSFTKYYYHTAYLLTVFNSEAMSIVTAVNSVSLLIYRCRLN